MCDGKRWLLVAGVLLGLCMVLILPGSARAEWYDELGPEWLRFDWSIESLNEADAYWTSDTPIPPGKGPYDWQVELIEVKAQILGSVWLDVTKEFGSTYDSGSAADLPFTIIDMPVNQPGLLKIDFFHGVIWNGATSDYRLHTSLENAEFGSMLGYDITGFRANAITAIKPVPEPGSLALFGGGALIGLVLWRRRRK